MSRSAPARAGAPSKGHYVVQVVAGAELAEVFVTLAALGQDGRDEKYIKRDEPLKYGFYPADRPISVALSGLPAAGLYRVRLGAVLKTGGSANKSLRLLPSAALDVTEATEAELRRLLRARSDSAAEAALKSGGQVAADDLQEIDRLVRLLEVRALLVRGAENPTLVADCGAAGRYAPDSERAPLRAPSRNDDRA